MFRLAALASDSLNVHVDQTGTEYRWIYSTFCQTLKLQSLLIFVTAWAVCMQKLFVWCLKAARFFFSSFFMNRSNVFLNRQEDSELNRMKLVWKAFKKVFVYSMPQQAFSSLETANDFFFSDFKLELNFQ